MKRVYKSRPFNIQVRVSRDERLAIDKMARKYKLSIASFIRKVALEVASGEGIAEWEKHREELRQGLGEPTNVY